MVVLAQEEGLVLLGLAILITVFVGSICGIVAVRKIAGLREIVSRLETAIHVLKDRIAAAEAALRRLTGGGVSGPEPVDKREGAAPSGHEGDVWIIEDGVRPEPEAAAPEVEAPPRPSGQAGPSREPDLRPRPSGQAGPSREPDLRPEPAKPSVAGPFLAGRALKIVHAPGCTHAKRISKKNRQKFDTLDAAFAAGKELCPKCLPPVEPEAEAPPPEPAKAGAEPEAPAPVPSTPGKAALLKDIASPAPPEAEEPKPSPLREAIDALRPAVPRLAPKKPRDQEWWNWFEETVGKRWTAWLGSVGFIVAAGLLVRLAYARGWFGPKTIIVLGVIVGLATVVAGERFIRRGMRPLGQGLVGTGLAVMYVSLYAGYAFHQFPPREVTFALLLLVTAGGVALAVARDALPISFLAVLGGLLTPVMLSAGEDARDVLFAYLLVLDIGVLAVAFFKNWRALDVLAFVGTWAYFSGWWIKFHGADSYAVAPTMVWLAAFYLVFLLQPFVYYLRAGSPIAGERFFMAVSNAAGMFGWAYAILSRDHPNALGLVALAMAGSYLALGAVTRKRVRGDVRAVFGFIALSVMFVTITIPILLDFHGMTVAWALEAPVLVYLAYKYRYFPVRVGALVPLALAGGRVLLLDWRAGTEAFAPVFNRDFGTAIFVAAAGWAYAVIQHRNRKEGIAADRFFKIATGIAAGFFALVVMHVEVWQWLDITRRWDSLRWATAFVWVAGAAGLLAGGMLLRSIHARVSGFVAFLVALVLLAWDYGLGTRESRLMFLDGRFLAGLAGVLVVFIYASVYRRSKKVCSPAEKSLSDFLHGAGILLMALLVSFETWQWLALRERLYAARIVLVFVWAAAWAAYLASGVRRRSLAEGQAPSRVRPALTGVAEGQAPSRVRPALTGVGLRAAGLVALVVSAIAAVAGYSHWHASHEGGAIYVNWLFVASATVPLGAFTHGFVLRRLKDAREPDEEKVLLVLYGTGIFLAGILASVETWLWLNDYGLPHVGRAALVFIWIAGSAGYLASGVRLRSIELRVAGLVALAASSGLAAVGYGYRYPSGGVSYFNWRFVAAGAVGIMAFVYAYVLRHKPGALKPEEKRASRAVHGVAIMAFLVLISWETSHWLARYDREYLARCLLPVIWALGSAGYLASGIRLRSMHLRAVGLFALVVAAIFAARGYPYPISGGHILYLNGRFLAGAAVVLMIFVHASVLQRFAESHDLEDAPHIRPLFVIVTAALLLLLSVETYLYFIRAIADPERARWVAQMALSIVWGVYASGVLAVGFWRKERTLRFAALGLFGATALKLLVIDMKKVEGGYKIASIFVVSLLLVGASYLYHRVEKWMAAAEGAGGEDKAGAAEPDEKKR